MKYERARFWVALVALLACLSESAEMEVRARARAEATVEASAALAARFVQSEAPKMLGADLTGELVGLLKAGSDSGNSSALVAAMQTLLEQMTTRLLEAHNASLGFLDELSGNVTACETAYKAADKVRFPAATSLLSVIEEPPPLYETLLNSYSQCKDWEKQIKTNLTDCDFYCLNQTSHAGEHCSPVNEHCEALTCSAGAHESLKAYLEKMIIAIDEAIAQIPPPCNSHKRSNASHCCNDIVDSSVRCFRNCGAGAIDVLPKNQADMPGCCAPRTQAEKSLCDGLQDRRGAWNTYDNCYNGAKTVFESETAKIAADSNSRASQMRSILRMKCLVNSFGDDQKSKLSQCMSADYRADPQVTGFRITLPALPAKLSGMTCSKEEIPGTTEFEAKHYGDLPSGLTACPGTQCQDICDLAANSSYDASAASTNASKLGETTTTTTRHLRTCYKATPGSNGFVFFDLGAPVPVTTITTRLAADTDKVQFYLTDSSPYTVPPALDSCGNATALTSFTAHCEAHGGARYIAARGFLLGALVHGSSASAMPSWCSMEVNSAPFVSPPQVGETFEGYSA